MTNEVSKEELRRRLREKIKNKRNGTLPNDLASSIRKDPQTAMMSMGIDDPHILFNAQQIVKNPEAFLKTIVSEEKNSTKTTALLNTYDDEEEGLPPESL